MKGGRTAIERLQIKGGRLGSEQLQISGRRAEEKESPHKQRRNENYSPQRIKRKEPLLKNLREGSMIGRLSSIVARFNFVMKKNEGMSLGANAASFTLLTFVEFLFTNTIDPNGGGPP